MSLLVNRGERGASYVMPDLIGVDGERAADILRNRGFRVAVVGIEPVSRRGGGRGPAAESAGRLSDRAGRADLARGQPVSVQIAPSILSADFAALGDAVAAVERGGADLIHVDVMDGHFVPNITIGVPVVRSLKRVARVPLDVHLMITDPDRYIEAFAEAGAAMISVHVEVLPHLHRTVQAIKALGVKAGVVLNPSTPVGALERDRRRRRLRAGHVGEPRLRRPDVHSAQRAKVADVRALLDRAGNAAAPIEIDGGIDAETVARVVAAGAAHPRGRIGDLPFGRIPSAPPATSRRRLPRRRRSLGSLGTRPAVRGTVERAAPSSRVRVRYAETDQMGVVYYANYFVWFEVGRTDLLRHAGWTYREMEARGVFIAGRRGPLRVPSAGALRR